MCFRAIKKRQVAKRILARKTESSSKKLKIKFWTHWLNRLSDRKFDKQMTSMQVYKLKQKTLNGFRKYIKDQKRTIFNSDIAYEHRYATLLKKCFDILIENGTAKQRAIDHKVMNNSKAKNQFLLATYNRWVRHVSTIKLDR